MRAVSPQSSSLSTSVSSRLNWRVNKPHLACLPVSEQGGRKGVCRAPKTVHERDEIPNNTTAAASSTSSPVSREDRHQHPTVQMGKRGPEASPVPQCPGNPGATPALTDPGQGGGEGFPGCQSPGEQLLPIPHPSGQPFLAVTCQAHSQSRCHKEALAEDPPMHWAEGQKSKEVQIAK